MENNAQQTEIYERPLWAVTGYDELLLSAIAAVQLTRLLNPESSFLQAIPGNGDHF